MSYILPDCLGEDSYEHYRGYCEHYFYCEGCGRYDENMEDSTLCDDCRPGAHDDDAADEELEEVLA